MIAKKIKYRINIFKEYCSKKFGGIKFSAIIGAMFYVLLLSVLIVNGATAYRRGVENLQKFDEELEVTNKLIAENEELLNLYRYYSSIDYKKIYARDNLNLGEKGETFYFIEKNEPLDIEKLETKQAPREVSNISLWGKLLFGV
jgi:cell division protein FtsB